MDSTTLETQPVLVRSLRPDDMQAVVNLDAKVTGRRRDEYFKIKLIQNLSETGVQVSLAAELDGIFVGFLLARVFYGEFGVLEPVGILDTFGVDPGFRRKGVGHSLLAQLRMNLGALGVSQIHSEVVWDDLDLIGFFQREGFRPAPRLCLDLDL